MQYVSIFLTASVLLVTSQTVHANISSNISLTTDYVWRGVSQNNENIALQGGFDYEHINGFYLGVWGSNVSFDKATTEIDFYGGWAIQLDNAVSFDIGIIEYTYHGRDNANNNNFTEAYLGLGFKGFGFQYAKGDELNNHWQLTYTHKFETASVNIGYFDYDNYRYIKAGISKAMLGLNWSIDYWNTDIDNNQLADARAVLSVSKSF